MPYPRFWLGLALGAPLGALATLLLRSTPPTAEGSPSLARAAAEPPSTQTGRANPGATVESPQSDRAAVESTSCAESEQSNESDPVLLRDVFAALEQALAERVDATSSPESHAAKYVGLSDRDLLVAEYALRQRLDSERSRIGAELLEMGEGESALVRPGETAPSMRKRPGLGVQSFAFSTEAVGNDTLVKYVSIDTDRHPQFGALQEEWGWLVGHLRDRDLSLLRAAE